MQGVVRLAWLLEKTGQRYASRDREGRSGED